MSIPELLMDVPSHFIEGTSFQYAWDSTSLGDLKTCPRLYQLKHIEHWTAKNENIHFRFGREVHSAEQEYHMHKACGLNHEQSLHVAVRDLIRRTWNWEVDLDTKVGQYKNRVSVVRAVVDHLDHYNPDPVKTYIKADGAPAVELSFSLNMPHTIGGQPVLLCGHLDRVGEFAGELYVIDTKTSTTTLGSYYFDNFHPDNQMTIYTIAAKAILNSPIRGVIIDAIQIMVDSTRSVRGLTYRTDQQQQEWMDDFGEWLAAAERYAANEYWPQNDKACRYCMFRDVCSKDPGRERERYLEANFVRGEPWNPLKPR